MGSVVRLPFDEFGVAVVSGTLFPMAVFGIIANFVTMVVIYGAPNLRSIFNYYIMSLCFSDLVSAMLSPICVYRVTWGYLEWKRISFLCKIYFAGDICTSIATSMHIVFFSGLRFVSIAKPHVFRRFTLENAKISIIGIWIFCIISGFIPYAIFMGTTDVDRNSNKFNKNWPSCAILEAWIEVHVIYITYVNAFLFYMPLLLVFIFSIATSAVIVVRRSNRRKARKMRPNIRNDNSAEENWRAKENNAILQLMLIVGSFAVGYIPNAVFYYMVLELKQPRTLWWFGVGAYVCIRFSECLNPIFYNLASSKLRAETLNWIRKTFACKLEARRNQARPIANAVPPNTVSKKAVDETKI